MTYQPQPTPAVPTGMHQVIPNRNPSVVGVRESFDSTFGGYTWPDWTLDAECTRTGTDPGIFFPERGGRSVTTDKALAICAQCIVREKCLEEALDFESGVIATDQVRPQSWGVRGGMTEKQRRKIVGERRAKKVQEAKDGALADYAAGELTTLEIAAKRRVTETAVVRWAQQAGIARGSQGREPRQLNVEGVS